MGQISEVDAVLLRIFDKWSTRHKPSHLHMRQQADLTDQLFRLIGGDTCMWHTLRTCKIIYDGSGRLTAAKKRFDVPYPAQLKTNIIDNNWKLLRAYLPAYELQIKKALRRGDQVSVNHRVSAFLESYFDLLFALNSQTHPGEKRLIPLCKEMCGTLPEKFEENLNSLFSHMFTDVQKTEEDLDKILVALAKLLGI